MDNNIRLFTVSLIAAAASLAVTTPGCSFATNVTAIQCTSEADCTGKGSDFEGTTCSAVTRTCVKVPEDADLCKTNKECIEKFGEPAICRKSTRKCVDLITRECPFVIDQPGQLLNDDTVVIGYLSPSHTDEQGDAMEQTIRLWQSEISTSAIRGLPPVRGGGPRPIVLASCLEFAGGVAGAAYEDVVRGAKHLVDDVGVPLILGPVDTAHTFHIVPLVTNPNRVLVVLPTGHLQNVGTLPSPVSPLPLVWNVSPDDTATVPASVAFVKYVESTMRAKGVTEPVRVVILVEGGLTPIADRLEKVLEFNGKALRENTSEGNYLRLDIGDELDRIAVPAPEQKMAAALKSLFDYAKKSPTVPLIVFDLVGPSAYGGTSQPELRQWPNGVEKAYHLDLIGTLASFGPMYGFMSAHTDRIFSFNARAPDAAHRAAADAWQIKFKGLFPQFAQSTVPNASIVTQWYDAAYLAAYAIAATGDKPLTGENIARTVARLQAPGDRIFVGTDDLTRGMGLATSGQNFVLEGLNGSLTPSPENGGVQRDVEALCPVISAKTGNVIDFAASGFYYDSTGKQGVGTVSCPITR